jgi:hypothetical protein
LKSGSGLAVFSQIVPNILGGDLAITRYHPVDEMDAFKSRAIALTRLRPNDQPEKVSISPPGKHMAKHAYKQLCA